MQTKVDRRDWSSVNSLPVLCVYSLWTSADILCDWLYAGVKRDQNATRWTCVSVYITVVVRRLLAVLLAHCSAVVSVKLGTLLMSTASWSPASTSCLPWPSTTGLLVCHDYCILLCLF